jgi:hypothetical protein
MGQFVKWAEYTGSREISPEYETEIFVSGRIDKIPSDRRWGLKLL